MLRSSTASGERPQASTWSSRSGALGSMEAGSGETLKLLRSQTWAGSFWFAFGLFLPGMGIPPRRCTRSRVGATIGAGLFQAGSWAPRALYAVCLYEPPPTVLCMDPLDLAAIPRCAFLCALACAPHTAVHHCFEAPADVLVGRIKRQAVPYKLMGFPVVPDTLSTPKIMCILKRLHGLPLTPPPPPWNCLDTPTGPVSLRVWDQAPLAFLFNRFGRSPGLPTSMHLWVSCAVLCKTPRTR